MAKNAQVGRLVLTHFRKYMDKKDLFDQALFDAREAFGDDVVIAEDLQEFEI